MKAFIEKVFKMKKQKEKDLVDEKINTKTKAQATEAIIEAIKVEVPKEEKVIYSRPGHYFPDCNCFKCVRWRNQNA